MKKLYGYLLAVVMLSALVTGCVKTSAVAQISREEVKNIAFTAAGVAEEDVSRLQIDLDYDDDARRWEYEIDFYAENMEYDMEIDATTGDILRNDSEIELVKPSTKLTEAPLTDSAPSTTIAPRTTAVNELISRDEAKIVALARVGSAAGQVVDFECELDFDDDTRHWEYEISFNVGRVEYEFVIDAENGLVIREKMDRDD